MSVTFMFAILNYFPNATIKQIQRNCKNQGNQSSLEELPYFHEHFPLTIKDGAS